MRDSRRSNTRLYAGVRGSSEANPSHRKPVFFGRCTYGHEAVLSRRSIRRRCGALVEETRRAAAAAAAGRRPRRARTNVHGTRRARRPHVAEVMVENRVAMENNGGLSENRLGPKATRRFSLVNKRFDTKYTKSKEHIRTETYQ